MYDFVEPFYYFDLLSEMFFLRYLKTSEREGYLFSKPVDLELSNFAGLQYNNACLYWLLDQKQFGCWT